MGCLLEVTVFFDPLPPFPVHLLVSVCCHPLHIVIPQLRLVICDVTISLILRGLVYWPQGKRVGELGDVPQVDTRYEFRLPSRSCFAHVAGTSRDPKAGV